MAVKIDDVAARAKVSIKTVSRVVNHEPHVRAELRSRVENAMKDLGYSPNIAAKRLASNRAFAIGLLYGGAPGEYFSQILHSILESSASTGYTVIVTSFVPLDAASRARIFEMARRKMIDGLILTPPCDNDHVLLEQLSSAAIPFVRLTPADTSSPLPYVAADDRRGAEEMTEHLIGLGHREIAFVYGDPKHHASEERYRGFVGVLGAHGLRFDTRLKRVGAFLFDRGVQAGRELLALDPRPTAIFASNDESAAGVLAAAHELGIAVPAELSIAGFDDFPSAQKTFPPLTTVRQPMENISTRAMQLLIDLITRRTPEALHIHVATTQVIRSSTAPCPSR
jgi:LacI family transcriptional regulator